MSGATVPQKLPQCRFAERFSFCGVKPNLRSEIAPYPRIGVIA